MGVFYYLFLLRISELSHVNGTLTAGVWYQSGVSALWWFRLAFCITGLPSQVMSILWRHTELLSKSSLSIRQLFPVAFAFSHGADYWLCAGQLNSPFLLMTAPDH